MSLGRILLLLGRLLTVVVLVTSGVYVLVYLVRWEWNRALVAGVFFLAAEAVVLASLVLSRLQTLSSKVTIAGERAQAAALAARLRANRPDSRGPFAWLSPHRTSVMLPFLIGAGVILAAVSYLVEQISRVTAVPIAENELARGLARMALPVDGLTPSGRVPVDRAASRPVPPGAPRGARPWTWAALSGVAVMVAVVILTVMQTLRTVPAPADPGRAIALDLQVMSRGLDQPPAQIAAALWATCRTRVPDGVELTGMEQLEPPSRVRLHLAPAPGTSDTNELLGCLQDAVIERARADLLAVDERDGFSPPRAPTPRA